ncbi:DUF805 domain-containing protein [Amnibacterium sp.]|uniref:DUF805 domain-containing protein n=1 Tax=Amnibacterium sp. TaxID=1872496 RepID=UPI002639B2EA|nr:DUF805 domain-containing protein [Amnibacterium sp.]MCU1472112.1 hypothetical protein [Amnibacterium sp.]
MRFHESIKTGFRKYAEFHGRASRSEFWWWMLFTALVSAALSGVRIWPSFSWLGSNPAAQSTSALAGIWSVVVLLPTLGLTVRRLRDAGHGWRNIFWLLLPLAGLIVLIVLCAEPSRSEQDGHDELVPLMPAVPEP